MNLYNEIDPYAAQWLRNLIDAGEIPAGIVDERSIEDLEPDYVGRFVQCHFFAGLGGWPLALALAGWAADRPVWTGSCPCQPFSPAGKGKKFADERHLWPSFDWLIGQCRPDLVLGEQVEGPAGREWLDLVATDLEGHGYAFGTAVFPASSVGAPQIRHRTYWLAHAARNVRGIGRVVLGAQSEAGGDESQRSERSSVIGRRTVSRMARADQGQCGRLAGSEGSECDGQAGGRQQGHGGASGDSETGRPGPVNGFWRDADWILCRDEPVSKWRPVEPGTFPLATGAPARVGRLRAYGNAICVPQAVAFVEAVIAYH